MARGSVNKVIIIGHLGSDPDIRYSASGTPVAKFNVATNERVMVGEGNWEDRTEWHRIVAFGKLAEICGNYLSKGRQIYLEGSLRTNQWEDAQGVKRYTTEIIARDIQFLGGAGDEQAPRAASGGSTYTKGGGQTTPSPRSSMDELPPAPRNQDDDIPF